MADTLDRVQKLIALALNNPDEEEARSAAMKAVSLIVAANFSIEGTTAGPNVSATRRAWRPDAEFDAFWDEMDQQQHQGFRSQDDMDREGYEPQNYRQQGAEGLKAAVVDTDIDDDFMRKRVKAAWRAIQRERARLKTEIYNFEQRYRTRYPRPEPKDWEQE